MIELIDTHCHIHFPDYELDPEEVIKAAERDGVSRLLCVGCTLLDSKLAIKFASTHKNIWATIGLHPHEGVEYVNDHIALKQFHDLATKAKVVAIGETGLDYHYMHSSKQDQEKLFRFQLDIAQENRLPLVFHVREAFADFFKILDSYKKLQGVVHSFSAGPEELEQILTRNLYVGINGIVTFAKNKEMLEAIKKIPANKLLLETDAPFLTPVPYRGSICEPKHARVTAEFLGGLRGESLDQLAKTTTQNAINLFGIG